MTTDGDRRQFEVLSQSECLDLLQTVPVGRVAFMSGGEPHVLPVNFAADAEGRVVFRTSADSLLTGIALSRATFEIDGFDETTRTGWSVCVYGIGSELPPADTGDDSGLRDLPVQPWAPGRDLWYLITPTLITGRRLAIVRELDAGADWFAGIPTS